ncbi:MAG: LysR family transcriptional regulator [Polyangiaceae bacterium]|nr:LysR family transcriptional regulator [Polyangiaceae bacterium]
MVHPLEMPLTDRSALAGIDANLLVALDALLAEKNVGRAARRVGLSPSAMSHALARARELLDDPILVRAGTTMVATPRARDMQPLLSDAVSLFAKALERKSRLDLLNERRTLRIAAVDFAQIHLLQSLAICLRKEAPLVTLVIVPFGATTFDELKSGVTSLAFAANRAAGMATQTLAEEPFVCVARSGHPALNKRLTAKRFAALDHVMIAPRGQMAGASDAALKRYGLRRRVALVVPTFLAAALAVAESELILTCAERSARQCAGWLSLSIFPPPIKLPPAALTMFWHPQTEADPFLAYVRGRAVELAAG